MQKDLLKKKQKRPVFHENSELGSVGIIPKFYDSDISYNTGVKGLNDPPGFSRPRKFHAKRGWPSA